ncbi:WD repeat domain 54-like isoform X1 [Vicugna pacos]|uniref:WD repeat domain 54-like isoform X1 n=1 Tax=Vicugna pacos TaxID=30538 RepID=A0ABM5BB63_VICPA
MFRRERSIPLRGSAAALCNHLSVLQRPVRNLTHFGVVHGPGAQLLSAAPEGVPLAQRQLHAKEGAGVSSPLITQMYKCDGSVMVYWHALDSGGASCGTEWGLAVRLEPRSSRPAGACSRLLGGAPRPLEPEPPQASASRGAIAGLRPILRGGAPSRGPARQGCCSRNPARG